MKLSAGTVITVVLLSLGIWVAFHYMGLDLTRSDTAVVVGAMLLLVLGAQWLVGKVKRKGTKT